MCLEKDRGVGLGIGLALIEEEGEEMVRTTIKRQSRAIQTQKDCVQSDSSDYQDVINASEEKENYVVVPGVFC